ncbi:outer membrane protein transport protein [bacterium]|nr:outer membrane protein transport protein [bacterium]
MVTAIAAICAIFICAVSMLFCPIPVASQIEPFSVSSPPTPVGSGARAMGMGGAFVAVADDATAASWNPAGLIQLQKAEVSGAYSWERRSSRRYSVTYPFFDGKEHDDASDINYLSVVYPFSLARRNMVCSLNYQKLYDFNRSVQFVLPANSYQRFDRTIGFESKGTLYTLSPAFAVQITDGLFLGSTVNIWSDKWTGKSSWKNIYYTKWKGSNNEPFISGIEEEYKDFRAVNGNLGILYNVAPKWKLGMVYKLPFRALFEYTYKNKDNNDRSGVYYGHIESIDFPPVYSMGVSYRHSDALTLSTDITRTDWNKLAWRNDEGEVFRLFTRFNSNQNGISEFPRIDPTYSLRFGAEYLKIMEKTVIPIRAGIFYDPIPSIGSPHDEYGISIGSGISLGDLIIDFAYQYRIRRDVSGSELGFGDADVFEDQKQGLFLLSMIYHF